VRCERLEQDIALFVEGDLPERQSAALEAHLSECPRCRQEADALRDSQREIKRVLGAAAPSDAQERVRARVLAAIASKEPSPKRAWQGRRYALAGGIVCATLIAVASFVWQASQRVSPSPAVTPTARVTPPQPAPAEKPLTERMTLVENADGQTIIEVETDNPNVCILLVTDTSEGDEPWST
jgi:anti-sigma factor RsiW